MSGLTPAPSTSTTSAAATAPTAGTAPVTGTAIAIPLVDVSNVTFAYDGAVALDGVSFQVRRGEAVALVGPNGCGKSTALRVVNGLAFPSAGTYRYDDEPVDARTMRDRRFAKRLHQRVGFVFQNPDVQLFCPSVAEEVAFGPRQMGLSAEEVDRRVADALTLFDVAHLAGRAPYHLSGGERRRVAMASVVSLAPELLVLDEPTNGLDDDSTEQVESFVRSFVSAGGAVLAASHDLAFVSTVGAREVRLDRDHRVVGPRVS